MQWVQCPPSVGNVRNNIHYYYMVSTLESKDRIPDSWRPARETPNGGRISLRYSLGNFRRLMSRTGQQVCDWTIWVSRFGQKCDPRFLDYLLQYVPKVRTYLLLVVPKYDLLLLIGVSWRCLLGLWWRRRAISRPILEVKRLILRPVLSLDQGKEKTDS